MLHQASSPRTGWASQTMHGQEEDLEAHQRDEHDQQAARLALRRDDQVGDEHADHREDDAVEHRVLHDEVGRDRHGGGVGHALEGRRAEECRRSERAAPGRVVDQEPHGDDGGSDEPGDDAFADVARFGGHSCLLWQGPPGLLPPWRPCRGDISGLPPPARASKARCDEAARAMRRAHLLRWRPRRHAQRTAGTPRRGHRAPPRSWTLLLALAGSLRRLLSRRRRGRSGGRCRRAWCASGGRPRPARGRRGRAAARRPAGR